MSDDIQKQTIEESEVAEDQQGEVVAKSEFDAVKELAQESDNKYKRALADYQNLEKRVREEKIQWIRTASKDVLLRMLPVVDTLLLAQQHSEDKTLGIATQQFLDLLKSEGVVRIETKNKKFDPMLMECISVVEGEEGKVVEELRVGFMIHDTVLRPAQVTVGKKE